MNVKPIMFSETDPLDALCDPNKVEVKRAIWQAPFSGLAGALSWDMQLTPQHFNIYGQVRSFIEGIDFDFGQWHPGSVLLGAPNDYLFQQEFADDLDGFKTKKKNRKADLCYLRSGDANFAIGVLTNKSYNIYTSADCLDTVWDVMTDPDATEEEKLWDLKPISPATEVDTQNEKLKMHGLFSSKYYINYFNVDNPYSPVFSSDDHGPRVKFEYTIPTNQSEYIVLFKARKKGHTWNSGSQILIDDNDNVTIDEKYSELELSNEELNSMNFEIDIFPNPTLGKLTIVVNKALINSELTIYSSNGPSLFSIDILEYENNIDLSFLKSGIYFANFKTLSGANYVKKIVIK